MNICMSCCLKRHSLIGLACLKNKKQNMRYLSDMHALIGDIFFCIFTYDFKNF